MSLTTLLSSIAFYKYLQWDADHQLKKSARRLSDWKQQHGCAPTSFDIEVYNNVERYGIQYYMNKLTGGDHDCELWHKMEAALKDGRSPDRPDDHSYDYIYRMYYTKCGYVYFNAKEKKAHGFDQLK